MRTQFVRMIHHLAGLAVAVMLTVFNCQANWYVQAVMCSLLTVNSSNERIIYISKSLLRASVISRQPWCAETGSEIKT
jgi:hypothetical protein